MPHSIFNTLNLETLMEGLRNVCTRVDEELCHRGGLRVDSFGWGVFEWGFDDFDDFEWGFG